MGKSVTGWISTLVCGWVVLIPTIMHAQVMIDPDLVDWTYQYVSTCPAQWTISPSVPSSSDTVSFEGPTNTFTNACYAEQNFGGQPALMINGLDRTVELIFSPPAPTQCTLLLAPVCGLHGTFGPLKPGTWTFKCTHADLNFELQFNVDGVATTRDIIYVDSDLLTLTPDGFSWETAFNSLQQALSVAEYGSRIKVAQGTYTPSNIIDPSATFKIPSGVTLEGGYRGMPAGVVQYPIVGDPDERNITGYPTVLSGDLNNDDGPGFTGMENNVYHVMDIRWTDANTVIDGVTLRDGFANSLDPNNQGGGLLALGSSAAIIGCIFTHNAAVAGGGASCRNFTGYFDECIFENNLALMHGGAVTIFGGWPVLVNSYIVGNQVPGDVFLGGSAISVTTSEPAIVNCTIADNRCLSGGALSFFGGPLWPVSEAEVHNCILYNGGNEITNYDGSTLDVTYSDVQGGWADLGNIDADPLFMWPGFWDANDIWQPGDYHLQGWSPCIDAGDPSFQTVGTDIDGDPRILGQIIEMGADELLPMAPPPLP